MKDKTETRKLAVYIPAKIKSDYNSGHQVFEYHIVTVSEDGKVRNCSSPYDEFTADFDDLTFRCQISHNQNDYKPYAMETEYRSVYSLDLSRAESAVRVLRKIQKASAKFPVKPETFGQYVTMVAQALGVTHAVQVRDQPRESSWHDETQHMNWKLSDVQWLIDRQIGDFVTEHSDRMSQVA